MKNTNIEKIRTEAITFAYLPIEPNERIPLFVLHPFINSSIFMLQTEAGLESINVLEGNGEERFREQIIQKLKTTNSVIDILTLMNKPYRFTFIKHVNSYLNDDDLAICLRYIWKNSEYTNDGFVFSKKQLLSLFKRSTKEKLMDKDELEIFQGLPERITIYRGVTSINSKNIKVFSWTLSLKQAKWFASRFNDSVQKVFQAELPKDGVLAYFSDEEEIIANPFMLENIKELNKS